MQSIKSNLVFSLNATIPIFLIMLFGWFMNRADILDDNTTKKLNKFAFDILLPALLFMDLSQADFKAVWDTEFVLFCLIVTAISIAFVTALSFLHKDKSERGEMIQASYRSSAAILGIAFVNNIYGHSEMAALMIVGTVPLYNIAAVIILSVTSPNREKSGNKIKLVLKTALDVIKNPIILGILIGIVWSLLDIPQPVILTKTVSYLSVMATPVSLLALGASVKIKNIKEKLPTATFITFIKLIFFCAVFLPVAVRLGFRGEKLVALLVMLGSATTGTCFIMCRNFGHDGTLTACTVMLSTLLSSFTLTFWLFILRSFGYI